MKLKRPTANEAAPSAQEARSNVRIDGTITDVTAAADPFNEGRSQLQFSLEDVTLLDGAGMESAQDEWRVFIPYANWNEVDRETTNPRKDSYWFEVYDRQFEALGYPVDHDDARGKKITFEIATVDRISFKTSETYIKTVRELVDGDWRNKLDEHGQPIKEKATFFTYQCNYPVEFDGAVVAPA